MRLDIALCAAAAALIAGCTIGPPYQRPEAELPTTWQGAPVEGVRATGDRWWTMYSDPALDKLVEESLTYNQDLAFATARVDEARAQARIVESLSLPSVDATFVRDRARSSERSAIPLPPSVPLERNDYTARLNVSYEADLWGRLKSASNAARATLLATEAARETVMPANFLYNLK